MAVAALAMIRVNLLVNVGCIYTDVLRFSGTLDERDELGVGTLQCMEPVLNGIVGATGQFSHDAHPLVA